MIHLPLYLEKRLKNLFPRESDRQDFVVQVVLDALETMKSATEIEEKEQAAVMLGGTIHVFSDGGSRGNPGQAAIGCVLYDAVTKKVLQEYKESIGIETNNIAEYKALIKGLELVQEFHPNAVTCHLDSELVVKQVRGEYKVKMPHLVPLIEQVKSLTAQLPSVTFVYIPRTKNTIADMLVNQALDALSRTSYARQ